MICIICNGEYPESKHDFINCISLDFKYDINQIDKIKYITLLQSRYRGKLCRKYPNDIHLEMVKSMIDNYITYTEKSAEISKRCNLKYKKIRNLNFPMEISENIVRFVINKKYRYIKCTWDIKSGDLAILHFKIEVKAFSSIGPSSFGPGESWHMLYFVDCRRYKEYVFTIYEIRLSSTSIEWQNIMVNKTETYHDQCLKKRRPRICFDELLRQIPNKYSIIFDGHIDQLQ